MSNTKWNSLYEEDIKRNNGYQKYYLNKIKYRMNFVKKVEKYSKDKVVLEAGCGTGVLSIYFKKNGFKSYAIDNDVNQLNLVKKISKSIDTKEPILKKINIFELSDYFSNHQIDVVYSIGVFEHFSDIEIEKLLEEQLKISKYVFVGIPTKYFNESEKLYGNERFLEIKYWRKLFTSNKYHIVEEFSCYNGNFINRLKNYKKWFKIPPIHVFVIKSCNKWKNNL